MSRPSRLARALVLTGVGALVGLGVAVAIGAVTSPAPYTHLEALADLAPALVTVAVVAGLALLALWRGDGPLLWLASGLAVLATPATIGVGLVAALLWLPAAMRLPTGADRRRVETPAALVLVGLLAVAAAMAPMVHRDPVCWEYTEDADGERTYVEVEPDRHYERGFGPPSLGGTGEASESVEVDPETGDPVEGTLVQGQRCESNRTTVPQAALALLLGAAALLAADRTTLPRPR